MSPLNNKKLLLTAVDYYSLYTKNQRSLLKYLINLSIDGVIKLSTSEASKNIKTSRANIYLTLDKFGKEMLLSKVREKADRHFSYTLNNDKLNYILQVYYNKQENK